jgi:hypothetical protein
MALGMVPVQARAVPISSVTYDLINSGTTYGTVEIDLNTNTLATITFTDPNGFQGSNGNATVAVDPNASSFSATITSPSGGTTATSGNGIKLNGIDFDLGIDYGGGPVTGPIIFTLTDNGATWANATNVLASGGDNDAGGHLYLGGSPTGFAFDNGTTSGTTSGNVPEPCTMLLLGSGLIGLAAFRSFKKA